jgi:hypothetical protein
LCTDAIEGETKHDIVSLSSAKQKQRSSNKSLVMLCVPGGNVSVLGGHIIGNSKMYSDEQQAMSSHDLQSAINVDGGIFENVLHYINCTNFVA